MNRPGPIVSLLMAMRPRVPIYIGTGSITLLRCYLDVYDHALYDLGRPEIADPEWSGFQEWVQQREPYRDPERLDKSILKDCVDEQQAHDKFWQLLDEYFVPERGKKETSE